MRNKPVLKSILNSDKSKNFLSLHWPNKTIVSHGRYPDILAKTEIRSLKSLARHGAGKKVRVTSHNADISVKKMFYADASQIEFYFSTGHSIQFHDLQQFLPKLKSVLRAFEGELKLPPDCITCDAFASPKGVGASPHFDPVPLFNIQLKGIKKWEWAYNKQLPLPLRKDNSQEWCGPIGEMPKEKNNFTARPGTVVFLPHGTWHSTLAQSNCFAIAIALRPEAWGKLYTQKLWQKMITLHEFRELSLDLSQPTKKQKVDQKIKKISDFVQSYIQSKDFLNLFDRTGIYDQQYQMTPGLNLKLTTRPTFKVSVGSGKNRTSTEVASELFTVLQWIKKRPGRFCPRDLLVDHPQLEAPHSVYFCEQLAAFGLIQPVSLRPK